MCSRGVAVEVRGLSKSYGTLRVLEDVSLRACWGEVTGIVGPNGAGKTTLLRIIAGLDHSYRGLVRVNGRPLMVFQENLLLPWKKLRDNIALGLLYRGLPRGEAYRRVERVAELLGFREHLDKYPWQVSGGTARKAAIARILVLDPDIILLDEPLAGLDPATRAKLLQKLSSLARREGKAVIVVDHAIEHVAGYSDKLYILGQNPARIIAELNLQNLPPEERVAEAYNAIAKLYRGQSPQA